MNKSTLRKTLRARRRDLGPETRAVLSARILAHLRADSRFTDARTVAAYAAMPTEVSLDNLWPDPTRTLLLPRTPPRGSPLTFHASETLPTGRGPLNIREPDTPPADLDAIDLWLIPGVGFDAHGARLGQGGAYYDQTLAGRPGLRVMVAFSCQCVPWVPTDSHDQRVHAIVTEDGWFTAEPPL